MVGGDAAHVAMVQPVFDALAPEGGFIHAGPLGAGHFVKMVHNGIEYGLMQAYAEGSELLQASELGIDLPGVLETWRHGSVVQSWLLDLLAAAVAADPGLSKVRGWAEDSRRGALDRERGACGSPYRCRSSRRRCSRGSPRARRSRRR